VTGSRVLAAMFPGQPGHEMEASFDVPCLTHLVWWVAIVWAEEQA
jgi:hypothetical protein